MQLHIDKVGPSKSGKALRVKCGSDWYGAKKDSGVQEGMTIEAEIEDGDFGKWIGKYRQITNGNGAPNAAQQPSTSSSSGSGAVGAAPVWANFVSNQVAHAIAAGRIEDPDQIKIWAAAAKSAFMELV